MAILSPVGKHSWRLKYRDPISKRVKRSAVPPAELVAVPPLTVEDKVEAWAVIVWKKLEAAKKEEDDSGATEITIEEATRAWLASEPWSRATVRLYASAMRSFAAYLGGKRRVSTITSKMLTDFRASARSVKPRLRGRKNATGTRELVSVNHEISRVASFLRWARLGAGCKLSRDTIAECLKAFKVTHERLPFLGHHAIRKLAELARKHEAPMWPAIKALLLTGLRRGELGRLEWSWVDEGDRIRVLARATKTRHVRDVDLTVAPEALPRAPANAHGLVFPGTDAQLKLALQRLQKLDPALAHLTAHTLRRTSCTFFTNAFNPWRSAKSHGHSVNMNEKHYAGLVRVKDGCTTLAEAMDWEWRGGEWKQTGIAALLAAEPERKPYRSRLRNARKDRGRTAAA